MHPLDEIEFDTPVLLYMHMSYFMLHQPMKMSEDHHPEEAKEPLSDFEQSGSLVQIHPRPL